MISVQAPACTENQGLPYTVDAPILPHPCRAEPLRLADPLIRLLHDGRRQHGRQCPPSARLRRAFPWTDATQVLLCYGVSQFLGGEVDVCKCCGAWREVSQHQPGDDSTDA